jgi:xanthine dehydrogenase molybdopterin-binding subunit B
MVCFGNRHGFLTTYKIGFSKEGKIISMEVNMYIDSGWHLDLSPEVLEVALWSVSSAYFVPNFRATGYVCRTNKVSGTAFRAFGRPQSALVAETMIEHIAAALGKDSLEIRKLNMIQVGQMVPTKQEVDVEMQRIWRDTLLQSKFDARLADRNTFNSANKWKKRGLSVVPLLFGLGITPKFLLQAGALVRILRQIAIA